MDASRECARAAKGARKAHPAQARLSTGQAGEGDANRPGAGRAAFRGVGSVGSPVRPRRGRCAAQALPLRLGGLLQACRMPAAISRLPLVQVVYGTTKGRARGRTAGWLSTSDLGHPSESSNFGIGSILVNVCFIGSKSGGYRMGEVNGRRESRASERDFELPALAQGAQPTAKNGGIPGLQRVDLQTERLSA